MKRLEAAEPERGAVEANPRKPWTSPAVIASDLSDSNKTVSAGGDHHITEAGTSNSHNVGLS